MKIVLKYIFLSLLIISFSSCQEEIVEIQEPPKDEAFTANSSVAALAQRVSLNDGSEDNIINGASCISFALPITVVVNGQEIIIESEEDYSKVEKILDRYEDDEDSLEVVFPVTVILPDYTKIIIYNEDDLEDYIEDCAEGGEDEDIECVDFQYPLEFTLYDPQNQITDAVIINNDEELFKFLEEIEDDVYISLKFPVTLILADGSEINAYDNDELEDIIEDSQDDCDEDDDNDFDDDDVDTSEFKGFLFAGSWKITNFFDVTDQTEIFRGWRFSFNQDNTVIATNTAENLIGEWESYGDSGVLEIDLDFDSEDPVNELDQEWVVIKYSDTRIELEDTSGGAAVTVVFEKL
ncbi:MAG: hypothetical protein ACNS60_09195 [Candidatus Cyclobacteriaceae bacterium M2_1C_046]